MKIILIALSLSFASAACSQSDCEKYAKMEWDCGDYPEAEKDLTLQMAEGVCKMAQQDDSAEANEVRGMFMSEVECAKKAKDCAEYEACKAKNQE